MEALRQSIAKQAVLVDQLKQQDVQHQDLAQAIQVLRQYKAELKQMVDQDRANQLGERKEDMELRANLDKVLVGRSFIIPSYEIYGGVAGLYDLGPPGCSVRDNILDTWKKHFVVEEMMLELSTSALTPYVVLKTSGHVDKFSDFMVRDVETGDAYRADKLLEEHIDQLLAENIEMGEEEQRQHMAVRSSADDYEAEELHQKLIEYDVRSPVGRHELSEPYPFNLMFETQIGPSGKLQGYLRPETAQGIFTNFRRLLDYNGSKMPFAAAQIGPAFRNEISPRSGLLRVREFTLAEIEHFCHPKDKSHSKFERVAEEILPLVPQANQGLAGDVISPMSAAEAVENGVINNETLAYFMVRTYQFLVRIGINPNLIRFRQHKENEMAHYASDCWDAEIRSTYGWVECVGHADRSAFDLSAHSKVSKVDLSAQLRYDEPIIVQSLKTKLNKGKLGPAFKRQSKVVMESLQELETEDAMNFENQLQAEGSAVLSTCEGDFEISREMVAFEVVEEKASVEKFVPAVIEPSFGVGRILYSLLEHSFWVRDEDENRRVLSLRPRVAPVKVSVLPLSGNDDFKPFVKQISRMLLDRGITINQDISSAFIGKRYARADELGIPFGVTIDFDTVAANTVTVRERDSVNQIRVGLDDLPDLLENLALEKMTWEEAYDTFPRFYAQEHGAAE